MDDRSKTLFEYQENTAKLAFEWLKQTTTLSFSAIVVITAFMDTIFVDPWWARLIPITLGLLLATTLGAVATMLFMLFFRQLQPLRVPKWPMYGYSIGLLATTSCFFGGVSCLTVFAIRNLI